jgi:hypothetical protein
MGGNGLSAGCLPCHKEWTPRTLKRYAEKTSAISILEDTYENGVKKTAKTWKHAHL